MKLCGICRLEKVESMEKILDLISKKVMEHLKGAAMRLLMERSAFRTGRIYVNTSATEQWPERKNIKGSDHDCQ